MAAALQRNGSRLELVWCGAATGCCKSQGEQAGGEQQGRARFGSGHRGTVVDLIGCARRAIQTVTTDDVECGGSVGPRKRNPTEQDERVAGESLEIIEASESKNQAIIRGCAVAAELNARPP